MKKLFFATITLLFLVACGGEGGTSNPNTGTDTISSKLDSFVLDKSPLK